MRANRTVFGKWGWVSLVAVLLLTGFVCAAFGQSATGTLTGTVTDPKGLAMANAAVTIHSADTGLDVRPVMTNDSGVYVVPLLPPGTYDITVSQAGFATVQHKGVNLQIGQTERIDIAMPVAAQQSLVTVTTEAPLLDTERTQISQNVNENLVSNLPTSSRRWEQFALLTPGVNPDGVNGGMSFHGINNLYNHNSVDGASNDSNYNGGSRGGPANDGYVYSADSIREFQVASGGFDAEVGQSAGGAVNAVTKSGSNQFHGDLFYNGRSNAFNAVDPVAKNFAASTGGIATQSIHQQHQWGGSAGGPLIKNRLFFFVTDDGYRKVNPLTATTNQLNPSIQNLTCPTLTAAGGTAGATAPSAAQCQAAKDFIYSHVIGTYARSLRQDVELVKLDSQLNQSNHVSAVANIRDWKQGNDSALQTGNIAAFLQNRFVIANWTTIVGTNKVNEARYQYGTDNSFNTLNGTMGMPGVVLSGITSSTGYGLSAGGSSWTMEWRHQFTDNFSWTKGAHQFKFGVDLNFIRDNPRSANNSGGNYGYTAGNSLLPNVSCAAPTVTTGQATANKENLILCDWMMDVYGKNALDGRAQQHWDTFNQFEDVTNAGYPASFQLNFPNRDYAGYVQDTWKLRSNVTVNLGLRYDVQIMTDLPNSVAKVLPKLSPGSFDLPILDTYTTTFPNDYSAIQPRFGVAWNVRKNTVLRFSGGTFVAKTEGHIVMAVNSGTALTTTSCTAPETTPPASNPSCIGPLNFPNVYFYQQNGALWTPPLPGAVPAVAIQTPTGATVIPNSKFGIRGIDPDLRRPRVYTIDVGIEQKLPGNMNLSIGYSYARGIALPQGRDFNISPADFDPNYCSTPLSGGTQTCNGLTVTKAYDIVDTNGVTQSAISLPFYSSRAAIAAGSGIVAAPSYSDRVDPRTGVINGNSSVVNSRYNGLLVTLRKPVSHGIELFANYTFSHATDDGQQGGGNSGEGIVGTPAINPFNNKPEQGNSGTDTRNRFTTSVVWAPTFGKKFTNGAAKQLLDGWSLSSSFIAQNGSAYTGMVSGSTAKSAVYSGYTPGSTSLATFTYTPLDGGMGGALITSPGANLAGRIAWVAPGSFVLPSLYNVDLRLTKEFAITERYRISIRGEAFNLFNTTLIQGVNQTAYDYAAPAGASGATGVTCPSAGNAAHTNTCMVPLSTFKQPTTTTGNLLGARQLQAGVRFEF